MPFDSSEFYVASPQAAPPVDDDVLRVLIEARALIATPGKWIKNRAHSDDYSAHCSVGALAFCEAAVNQQCVRTRMTFVGAAETLLVQQLPAGFFHVSSFNDTSTTTHADALSLFDRAIAARRAELEQAQQRAAKRNNNHTAP